MACDKMSALDRVDKFQTEQDPQGTLMEREFSNRRDRKKQRKREINNDRKLTCYKYLYAPALLGIVGGTVLVFGSTVRSISEGSFMWIYRDVCQIVGPIFLGLGVLFLLIGTGLVSWRKSRVKLKKGYSISRSNSRESECESGGTLSRQSSTSDSKDDSCIKKKKGNNQYSKLNPKSRSKTSKLPFQKQKQKQDFNFLESEQRKTVSDFEVNDLNLMSDYIASVWVKRSDFTQVVEDHRENGRLLKDEDKPKRHRSNYHKTIARPFLNFKSGMETIYEYSSSQSSSDSMVKSSSSVESTVSCEK